MEARRNFRIELDQLEKLHLGTLFSYDEARVANKREVESGFRRADDEITRPLIAGYSLTRVARTSKILQRRLKNVFPKLFREIVLVRAISILEVFMMDTVREVFLARKDLFQRDDKLDFSYGQLLAFSSTAEIETFLINRECRTLQNSSFQKVCTYFENRLGVKLSRFPGGLNSLNESFERRHLLVHRLGRTDSKYRETYATGDSRLVVSTKYIARFLENIRAFAEFVSVHSEAVIKFGREGRTAQLATGIAHLRLELVGDDASVFLRPAFAFACGDHIVHTKDVMHGFKVNADNVFSLNLAGNIKHVQAYIDCARSFQSAGHIIIRELRFERKILRRDKNLPEDFISELREQIIDKQVTGDVHQWMMSNFDLTRQQVRRVVRRLADAFPITIVPQHIREMVKLELPAEPLPKDVHKSIAATYGFEADLVYIAVAHIRAQSSASDTKPL